VALISGEPGIGKTRLASELLDRHGRSICGLRARAHSLGGAALVTVWVEALEGRLKQLASDELRSVCGDFVDDLASVLRSVAAISGPSVASSTSAPRLVEGLAVVLDNLSRKQPVIAFLDDIHFADPGSLEVLDYMSRSLATARALVVLAARGPELADNRAASEVLAKLEQEGQLRKIHLNALPRNALQALVQETLGMKNPSETLLDWLDSRSRGNALYALSLLTALRDEGADLTSPKLRLPEDIRERVAARTRSLEPLDRALLEGLAVAARRTELREVPTLAELAPERLALGLERLTRAGLVIEDEQGGSLIYEIAHPIIQEAIYQNIGIARRRLIHRRIGRALIHFGLFGDASAHFVKSADVGDEEAIGVLLAALRTARQRDSHHEAMTLVGAITELLPARDPRWRDVLDVVAWQDSEVLDHQLDTEVVSVPHVVTRIERALAGSNDPATRAMLSYVTGNYMTYRSGDLAGAERAYRESIELNESSGEHSGSFSARLALAWLVGVAGNLVGQASEARALLANGSGAVNPRDAMLALTVLGHALVLQGEFEDARLALQRSLDMARAEGHMQRAVTNLSLLAQNAAFEGDTSQARSLLAAARTEDATHGVTILLDMSARIEYLAGDFDGAIQNALEAVRWTRGGLSKRRAMSVAIAAMAAAESGQMADALEYLRKAKSAYAGRDWYTASHHCTWAQGFLEYVQGESVAGISTLDQAATAFGKMRALPLAAFVLADLAEAAGIAGDLRTTESASSRLRSVALVLDRDLYHGLAEMGTAWHELASGADERAADAARRAISMLKSTGFSVLSARAQELLGRALVIANREQAVETLAGAVEAFRRSGAMWRRDRATRLLARLGHAGRRKLRAGLGLASLSRREGQVVGLAARGMSAKEIGQRLFIGERTVETHLANAYIKLGLESKMDLVRKAPELGL
jgi:DNA-binding CsgD family transcriptional regulator